MGPGIHAEKELTDNSWSMRVLKIQYYQGARCADSLHPEFADANGQVAVRIIFTNGRPWKRPEESHGWLGGNILDEIDAALKCPDDD